MQTLTRWGLPLLAVSLATSAPAFAEEAAAESKSDTARAEDPATATDASEQGHVASPLLAPRRAFEIGVNAGYAQPFGNIDPSRPIGDIADAGGAVGLDLTYRVNPHWSVGGEGQFHESAPDSSLSDGTNVRGVSGTLLVSYHFLPFKFVDPYASLGLGYRGLFVVPEGTNNNETIHGVDVARALFGVDFRVSNDIAIGPLIGANATMLLFDDLQSAPAYFIQSSRPFAFIFAGAGARFDIAGKRVGEKQQVVARP